MDCQSPPRRKELRFPAYLEHAKDRTVLRMTRDTWQAVKPHQGEPVLIDLSRTPMANVAKDAAVIAATAHYISSSDVEIAIYRCDPKDAKPINVDFYSVWENLPSSTDYHSIVAAASTEDNENLRAFLSDHVFIVSKAKKHGHWLFQEELPSVVKAVIQVESSGDACHDTHK